RRDLAADPRGRLRDARPLLFGPRSARARRGAARALSRRGAREGAGGRGGGGPVRDVSELRAGGPEGPRRSARRRATGAQPRQGGRPVLADPPLLVAGEARADGREATDGAAADPPRDRA